MRKYYLFQIGQPVVAHSLSWSHYTILLSINDLNKINYYISICEKENLSKRKLQERIKNNEYERLPEDTRCKLVKKEEIKIDDFIKNPIIIKNNHNNEDINERLLQKIILEDIESFMKELGTGYTFVGSEYKIKLDNTYNYIDLLLFNYIYNSFIVIELKVTELKKEHIGQIQIYMN